MPAQLEPEYITLDGEVFPELSTEYISMDGEWFEPPEGDYYRHEIIMRNMYPVKQLLTQAVTP